MLNKNRLKKEMSEKSDSTLKSIENSIELLERFVVDNEYEILEETFVLNINDQLTRFLSTLQEYTIFLESFYDSKIGSSIIDLVSSKIIYFITSAYLSLLPFQNDYVKNILEKFFLKFSVSDGINTVPHKQFLIQLKNLKEFLIQVISLIDNYLAINDYVLLNYKLLEINNIEIVKRNSIKLKFNKFQLLDTLNEMEILKVDYKNILEIEQDDLNKQKEYFRKLRTIYKEIRTSILSKFFDLKTSVGTYIWIILNSEDTFEVDDDALIFADIIELKSGEITLMEDIDILLDQYNKWENELYGKKID